MRILPSSLIACVLLATPAMLTAQDRKVPFDYDKPVFSNGQSANEQPAGTTSPRLSPRYTMPRSATARLMHERALMQARQRRARIQIRKWTGKSLLRPNLKTLRRTPNHWLWDDGLWSDALQPRFRFQWRQ